MLIWLDGVIGAGKTTTANKIKSLLGEDRVKVFDSDEYSREYNKENEPSAEELFNALNKGYGSIGQKNKSFLDYFKTMIENQTKPHDKIIIITMALTEKECKEILFDDLNRKYDILHVILEADVDTIIEHIKHDLEKGIERDESYMDKRIINNKIEFLKNSFPNAIRINIENKDELAVSKEIIEIIKESQKEEYINEQ